MSIDTWVVTGPQIIEVDHLDALRVGLVRGRVDVVAHDEPGARIEVHSVEGRPLEVSLTGGELRVGYAFTLRGWDSFLDDFRNLRDKDTADVHIAVPRHLTVQLGTVGAEGLLAGVLDGASVSTVSGSIVTDGTRGAVVANSVSGEIVVRSHDGDLRFNSVSGELTASGELARVVGSTVSGPITLDVSSQEASIVASSVSGNVTIRLPAGRGVNVSARSLTGRVVVDGHEHKGPTPGQTKVELQRDDGTCSITANTVSGHLTVLRGPAL